MEFTSKFYFTPTEFFKLFSLTTITLTFSIYLLKNFLRDIKKGLINNVVIPVFSLPVFIYYFIPLIYILLCSLKNLCWSINLNDSIANKGIYSINIAEKYIYSKYLILIIFSLIGFNIGIFLYKKIIKKGLKLPENIKNIFFEEIKTSNKFGRGLFFSYIAFSLFLIFIALYQVISTRFDVRDLYYFASFGRLYSIYNFFFFTPAILIGFAISKKRDLFYTSIVFILKSFVLYICLGRTFQSLYLFAIGISIFYSTITFKNKQGFLKFLIFQKNKLIRYLSLTIGSFSAYILFTKIQEIISSITYWTFDNKLYKPLVYTQMIGNIIGSPKLNSKHFINSLDHKFLNSENFNLFLSQFHPIIYPPYLSRFLPDGPIKWYESLSDNLLNLEIQKYGGTHFGSALGFYSYFPYKVSAIFIILFSALNIFLLYYIANNLEINLSNNQNHSFRIYFFIFSKLPFNETWGGGIFPSQIIWMIITCILIREIVKLSKKFNF